MIEVRIAADSVNPNGVRLTSWILKYPRFIHSEFMTHRVFSRSAASSRAIPISRMIRDVIVEPACPEFWGANEKGMQSSAELSGLALWAVKRLWLAARWGAVLVAWLMSKSGAHKQLANRLLEPWAHITVLATCTDHSNFFALRAHPAAQPEFQVLAYKMLAEYVTRCPLALRWGEWHIPRFGDEGTVVNPQQHGDAALKVATAHCARLSYKTQDGKYSTAADMGLFNRLSGPPMHAAPFEHSAQAIDPIHATAGSRGIFKSYPWSNFDAPGVGGPSGWGQYRKATPGECTRNLSMDALEDILINKPKWIDLL